MKKYLLSGLSILFIALGCTSKIDFTIDPPVPPAPVIKNSDLLISEISTAINTDPLAAGTRPHYVELYNGTAASVNLADYAIGYFAVSDAATLSPWVFPIANVITLRRTLATEKCYVIASIQADATVIKSDTTWGTSSTAAANASVPLQLSGNSAIALLKKDAAGTYSINNTNYKIIDVFGSPLVARIVSLGSTSSRNNFIWTIAGETSDTRNRTFFRKKTVINPTTDWALAKGTTALDSQWQISGDRAWDYTNLGLPSI
jgi:hypothetical protein